jgi:hypothetical protein
LRVAYYDEILFSLLDAEAVLQLTATDRSRLFENEWMEMLKKDIDE